MYGSIEDAIRVGLEGEILDDRGPFLRLIYQNRPVARVVFYDQRCWALDLHHMTKSEAISAMSCFLGQIRRQSHTKCRIITGKGIHSPKEPVLLRAAAKYLKENGLRHKLDDHGGAYDVNLKT